MEIHTIEVCGVVEIVVIFQGFLEVSLELKFFWRFAGRTGLRTQEHKQRTQRATYRGRGAPVAALWGQAGRPRPIGLGALLPRLLAIFSHLLPASLLLSILVFHAIPPPKRCESLL
jgi:hypothetical protein